MKTTDYIANTINRLPKGYVFTYDDFQKEVNNKEAIIKALNRMAVSGKIEKISKGKYYKPEKTVFGNLEPSQRQIVKDLLEDNGKVVGYLTGLSIYNQLGFTSQVSNTIQIGKNEIRPQFERGRYSISFVKQKNTINKENIPSLQLLDVLRFITKIPDSTIENTIKRFIELLKNKESKEISNLQRLALKYQPSVRALLGAILEQVNLDDIEILKKSLNPITKYNFKGADKVLTTSEKWNIR
ncbi:type IV toxin-antitoxin system AbiEi family antitoxin domain-containing protein [Frigoriflavimonas asaccharolytica]|uniref:Transcriptional regulator, AbiEi antitoxin, Type IV TA system n=1 Tax=Frigoriflavimonas asaccharolytica TaxID=2735899 RepID=A0A8J8KAL0_9FLAO|nr:DUF6088 family protein [Frigoriflavimonas asaccharolytica]NRS91594.1 hypothetical protein [Frigoriflavimonas asaccharolytica]